MNRIFKILANAEFEAEDIVDAFDKLSNHFKNLYKEKESDLIIGGEIYVELCEENKISKINIEQNN